MANEYYNLAGWLRDVRAVLNGADDRAGTYRQHLYDLIAELIPPECYGGDDEPVPVVVESEDADADLAGERPRNGRIARSDGSRARQGGTPALGGSPRLGDTLPRDLRQQERAAAGDLAPVARARPPVTNNVMRTEHTTEPLPLNPPKSVPRGTQGGVRKRKLTSTRTRGKSQTSARGRGKVRR